jgi:hypothetical protein
MFSVLSLSADESAESAVKECVERDAREDESGDTQAAVGVQRPRRHHRRVACETFILLSVRLLALLMLLLMLLLLLLQCCCICGSRISKPCRRLLDLL